jgi:hypothetical protein
VYLQATMTTGEGLVLLLLLVSDTDTATATALAALGSVFAASALVPCHLCLPAPLVMLTAQLMIRFTSAGGVLLNADKALARTDTGSCVDAVLQGCASTQSEVDISAAVRAGQQGPRQ